jgi:hypothetical protein
VLQAIKDEQFWILTHDDFDEQIRGRAEDILARRNPTPRPPTAFQAARDGLERG